jgi:hypothetical protein
MGSQRGGSADRLHPRSAFDDASVEEEQRRLRGFVGDRLVDIGLASEHQHAALANREAADVLIAGSTTLNSMRLCAAARLPGKNIRHARANYCDQKWVNTAFGHMIILSRP